MKLLNIDYNTLSECIEKEEQFYALAPFGGSEFVVAFPVYLAKVGFILHLDGDSEGNKIVNSKVASFALREDFAYAVDQYSGTLVVGFDLGGMLNDAYHEIIKLQNEGTKPKKKVKTRNRKVVKTRSII